MTIELSTRLGPISLKTPLVAMSGTVGSVIEFDEVTDFGLYGAAVTKSVSAEPWAGKPAPRLASVGPGMLNGIGIQNPGIEVWIREIAPRLSSLPTQVWGSAVGKTVDEFATVAEAMARAGVAAIEVNLSCPNLDGRLFSLDARLSGEVIRAVRAVCDRPVGAKLSPNSERIAEVAGAVAEAGADWVTLTNTVWGAGIDLSTRRPLISGVIGGYSGPPLKPLAMRCVIEVHRELPQLPILGSGGVRHGDDVVEYLLAGASAVGVGTAHFESPRIAGRILRQLRRRMRLMGVGRISELVGAMET